eukprot:jgi/Tetstr1/449696/TSEL_036764.t1
MASGKKAADPTKATPADSLAETPAEPTELTWDTTTLALVQAPALKVDALSTRLDERDNNKNKEQRDIPSDDDESGCADVVDGLLATLEDKRLEVGLEVAAKAQASIDAARRTPIKNRDKTGGKTGDMTRD